MFHTEFAKKTVRAHYLTSTRLLPNRQSAILFPPRQLYESRPLTELHLRKGKLNLRIKVEAVTAGPDAKLSDICAQIWTTNLKNTVASAPTLTGSVVMSRLQLFLRQYLPAVKKIPGQSTVNTTIAGKCNSLFQWKISQK